MATSKRERQKAARREKLEAMQRAQKRRKNIRRAVIVVVVAVLILGTGALLFSTKGNNTAPSVTSTSTTVYNPTTTTAPASNTATTVATSYASIADPSPAGTWGKAPTVVVPSGAAPTSLEVSDLIKGTGATLEVGDKFTAQYVLATYSTHKVIQSSWTSSSFSTTLSDSDLIPGWVDGLAGMKVGGRRELIVPPSLGYGDTSPGTGIAKDDTLVFVVDLLKIDN